MRLRVATTFSGAGQMLGSMFGLARDARPMLATLDIIKVAVIVTALLILHWRLPNWKLVDIIYRLPWWLTGVCWAAMLCLIILSQESRNAFIYFQF